MDIFSIVMVLTALFFIYFVVRNINKNSFLLANASVWLLVGLVLLLFSLLPGIPDLLANLLGFQLASNFLLFLAVIFLLVLAFIQSVQLSKQKSQITTLIQELSLMRSETKEKEQDEQ